MREAEASAMLGQLQVDIVDVASKASPYVCDPRLFRTNFTMASSSFYAYTPEECLAVCLSCKFYSLKLTSYMVIY